MGSSIPGLGIPGLGFGSSTGGDALGSTGASVPAAISPGTADAGSQQQQPSGTSTPDPHSQTQNANAPASSANTLVNACIKLQPAASGPQNVLVQGQTEEDEVMDLEDGELYENDVDMTDKIITPTANANASNHEEGTAPESPPDITRALEAELGMEDLNGLYDPFEDDPAIEEIGDDSAAPSASCAKPEVNDTQIDTKEKGEEENSQIDTAAVNCDAKSVAKENGVDGQANSNSTEKYDSKNIFGNAEKAVAAEWEVDSEYSSSSDDSSSDDSEDDSHDGSPRLGIEETVRLLMKNESGGDESDDEEDDDKDQDEGPLKTKHEEPELILPKPEVIITKDMAIKELGIVEAIVDTTVLIHSSATGRHQILDMGSVLCTEDRVVLGAIHEQIGQVDDPRYILRYATIDELKENKLEKGSKVYFSVMHAKQVLTKPLEKMKGTDASNAYDEEIGENAVEFSDDEAEQEFKKDKKRKADGDINPGSGARGAKGNKGRSDRNKRPAYSRPPPSAPASHSQPDTSGGLNYDDIDDDFDDGPYKPLSRPTNFGQGPPPGMNDFAHGRPGAQGNFPGGFRGGRGDFRGRGRGRGWDRRGGGRGRGGHGGFQQNDQREGYSLPPQGPRADRENFSQQQQPGRDGFTQPPSGPRAEREGGHHHQPPSGPRAFHSPKQGRASQHTMSPKAQKGQVIRQNAQQYQQNQQQHSYHPKHSRSQRDSQQQNELRQRESQSYQQHVSPTPQVAIPPPPPIFGVGASAAPPPVPDFANMLAALARGMTGQAPPPPPPIQGQQQYAFPPPPPPVAQPVQQQQPQQPAVNPLLLAQAIQALQGQNQPQQQHYQAPPPPPRDPRQRH